MDWKYQLRLGKVNTDTIDNKLITSIANNINEALSSVIEQISEDVSVPSKTKETIKKQLMYIIADFENIMNKCDTLKSPQIDAFNKTMNDLYNIADQKITSVTFVKYKFLWIHPFME